MLICIFPECHGHDDRLDAAIHGIEHLAASLADIKRTLRIIISKEGTIMTQQDNIDAAVAAIGTAVADLRVQTAAVQTAQVGLDAEIQALKTAVENGEPVDTTALVAAGQALADATGQLDTTVAALVADPNIPTGDPGTPADTGDGVV